jgi:hypothetical protein
MEHGATNAKTGGARKVRLHRACGIHKTDSAQDLPIARKERHAQLAQCFQSARHQAFATSFVNGRFRTICNSDIKTLLPRRDSCR